MQQKYWRVWKRQKEQDMLRSQNWFPHQRFGADNQLLYGRNILSANPEQKFMRRMHGYVGDGDYRSVLSGASRGIGAIAGGAQGFMSGGFGGLVSGAKAGFNSGAGFSKYMGWGDYAPVSGNDLVVGSGSQQQIAVNQSDASGDIFVQHTEFVCNIDVTVPAGATQTDFVQQKFPINPGLSRLFPFLSHVARNYILYDFQGLMLQYKPTSGEGNNSSNNAIGKVMLATQYDPDAPDFVNAVQMENFAYSNSCKPSAGAVHGVETAPGKAHMDMMYVRHADSPKDLSFTDLGNFYIATQGIPGAAGDNIHIGELWVTYNVRLSRPSIDNNLLGKSIQTYQATWSGAVNDIMTGSVTPDPENDLSVTVTRVSATAVDIYFPVDVDYADFKILARTTFSGTDTGQILFDPVAANHDYVQFWNEGVAPVSSPTTAELAAPEAAVATTTKMVCVYVSVDAPGTNRGKVRLTQSATADNGAYTLKINKIQGFKRVSSS